MGRTVIEFPNKVDFSTDYTVLIADINSADHLGADRLFAIVIESQMRFFAHLGYANAKLVEGVGYIISDTEFIFKSEAKHGDTLLIDVAATNFTSKGFELLYRIHNSTKERPLALVKAGMVFFDYDSDLKINSVSDII